MTEWGEREAMHTRAYSGVGKENGTGNTGVSSGVGEVKRPLGQEENKQDKEEKEVFQNIRDSQVLCQNVSLSLRARREFKYSLGLAYKISS